MTVVDEYGVPVTGAAVSVGGSQVGTTDDGGVLNVEVPAAGEQTIEATATETATATATAAETTTTGGGGPGFGPLVALVALLVAAIWIVRPSA